MTLRSAEQLTGKFREVQTVMADENRSRLKRAAQVARSEFLGAPGAPHRVAGRPTTVSARPQSTGIAVRWNGPAHLVNNPTRAHDIQPRGFVGTRSVGRKAQRGAALLAAFGLNARSAQGALRLADGQMRTTVHHPGTRGKHFFEKGRDRAVPAATKEYRQAFRSDMAKVVQSG